MKKRKSKSQPHNQQAKKIKPSCHFLDDDTLCHTFSFLSPEFILTVLMKVSKGWRLVAQQVPIELSVGRTQLQKMVGEGVNFNLVSLSTISKDLLDLHSKVEFVLRLRKLSITNPDMNDGHVSKICECDFENLETLELVNNRRITSAACEMLANCEKRKNLTSLSFSFTKIGDLGVGCLCSSLLFTNMRHLDLQNVGLTEFGAVLIATSPTMKQLKELDLSRNGIGNSGISAITNSSMLSNLEMLWLSNTGLDDEGVKTFGNSFFYKMKLIDLEMNNLSVKGAIELAEKFPNILMLDWRLSFGVGVHLSLQKKSDKEYVSKALYYLKLGAFEDDESSFQQASELVMELEERMATR